MSHRTNAQTNTVAEGSTDAFDLTEVLQLAGMSRVFTVVEVHSCQGTYLGSIYLKGGQVLESVTTLAGGDVGLVALSRLIRYNQTVDYRIFRATNPEPMPRPLGRVEALLLEVHQAEQEVVPQPMGQRVQGPWGDPGVAPFVPRSVAAAPPGVAPVAEARSPDAVGLTPLVTAMVSTLQAIDGRLAALATRPEPVISFAGLDARLAALSRPAPRWQLWGLGVAAATAVAFLAGGAVGASVVLLLG